MFAAKTVNLAQIATFCAGRATSDSNYKRIKRFLRFFEISQAEIAKVVIRLMKLTPPFVPTIDRTEWQLGKTWVNVLMLAVVSERGVAVPLLWTVFQQKGCSSDLERKALLEKYLSILSVETISFVTADREFASQEWLQFLNQRRIGFCLRIKANTQITDKRGKLMKARQLLLRGALGEAVNCRRKVMECLGAFVWQAQGVRRPRDCGFVRGCFGIALKLSVALAHRDFIRVSEDAWILFGGNTFDRDRESFPLAVFAGSSVLLGDLEW